MEPLYVDARPHLYKSWFIPTVSELGVAFMGDFQYNPSQLQDVDVERIQSWIHWAKAHRFRIVLTGDLIDPCSPSARKEIYSAFARAYGHAREAMDEGVRLACDKFVDVAKEVKGCLDGSVAGHHSYVFENGQSSTEYIMRALGGKNLGDSAIVVYDFGQGLQAWVWLHHGSGYAVTPGGILARGERIAERVFADLYVYGHLHQNLAWKLPWIYHKVRGRKVVEEGTTRRIMAVGGALKGYVLGRKNAMNEPEDGYVGKAMLPPVSLGWGAAFFRPMYEERRIDINVSI